MNVRSNISGHLFRLDTSDARLDYRSGASYHGSLKERKRSGRGVFRWPNGSCYKGDFVENKRHGDGIQEWPDGSSYVGQFKNDVREGYGRHTWCNGEIYEGTFLCDRRHGKGIYFWPDGMKYDGFFHNDLKDGFGTFVFGDGKRFEGLYKNNERNGPGILSYCDGRQDIGIWLGEKLIKLCAVMENAFVFQHFPDYYVNAGENLPLKVRRANSAFADSRNVISDEVKMAELNQENHERRSEAPVALQLPVTFPYNDILRGVRSANYGPKGPCEVASEQILRAAGEGDCIRVTELLEGGLVHVDVADKTGFTSLLAASGLYKNNERNGPGILSYCDGRQDIGIWLGEKLIKLCAVMENAFVFQHFPDYYVNAGENLPLKVRRANSAFADSRNVISDEVKMAELNQENHERRSEAPVALQLPVTFPYNDILRGVRSANYGPKGPCEVASEQILRAAGEGDCIRVTELLEGGLVHVDVADKTGFTSLLAASVNCHKGVINCLLDYGADVNKLNYEGLSALAACHVLFYTKHTWKDNIAETLAEENLFNSVYWDIPSGTFIQRKNRDSCSNIKLQVSPGKPGQCNLETSKEGPNGTIGNNYSYFKADNTKSHDSCDPLPCHRNTDNCNEMECAKSIKCTESNNTAHFVKCNSNFENGEEKSYTGGELYVTDNFDQNSFDVKRFIDQHSNPMDKNIFIHEFLSRTASAMSFQNSSISLENMEISLENCPLDNRERSVTDATSKNPENIMEFNKTIKNFQEKKNSGLGSAFFSGEGTVSVPYSLQNAISSSVQNSSNIDDVDSLNSVVQNRQKLLTQQRRPHLEATVRLLLKRGADPNTSSLPMPVLFFAVKAADTAAVEILLDKGARTDARLSIQKLGITPLHIAVALPSDAVAITELLLKAGADPDMRDFAFGKKEPGRTPLHTACCREDNDEETNRVISLLLNHKANPDLLCKGHSALSLAIASGNDFAVDTLVKHHANPSLPLTHGVGSALCAAVSFSAERRRKVVDRIRLVNKLIRNGANILAPIVVSNEHPPGTVVDYAYCVFYQDRRIANTPYHALTSLEREIYVARRRMLDHLAELLRTYVLKKEKKLLEEQLMRVKSALRIESSDKLGEDKLDRTVSFWVDESERSIRDTGIDSSLEKMSLADEQVASLVSGDARLPDCGLRVAVVQTPADHMNVSRLSTNSSKKRQLIRKNRFRYCYECGRSVGVRLSACTRCKEVFYCGRSCKLKAWNSRHKEECIRLSGTNKRDALRRTDSPTPVTDANKDNTTSKNLVDTDIKRRSSTTVSRESSIKKSPSGHSNEVAV